MQVWWDYIPQSGSDNRTQIVIERLVAGFSLTGNNCLLAMSKCRGELDVDIIWALAVQHFLNVDNGVSFSSPLQ